MDSWEPVSCGSNRQWSHNEVGFWLRSGFISFLSEASHKLDLWSMLLELKVNSMLYEAKKHLSHTSWYRIKHSACGGVTTAKICMGHNHGLYPHKKIPDSLKQYLTKIFLF